MSEVPLEELTEYLSQYITENKRTKIEEALKHRTRYLTVVVEDVYQPHNASAVVRTCDCFGIQELHIIENKNQYKVNPDVTLGSAKWVDIVKHNKTENNTISCLKSLKARGYKVYATTPHEKDVSIYDLPLDQKLAIVLGNELEGLSNDALEHADGYVKIPMVGFTESLNISVTAAIFIHHLTWKLSQSDIQWKLSDQEKLELKLRWIKNIIQRADAIEKDYLLKRKS